MNAEPTKVSREKAKALIDAHHYGVLTLVRAEPKDVLGTVEAADREYEHEAELFAFGTMPGEPDE